MKTKILLSFAILVCTAITAHAQINKGRYLLGGSIGVSSSVSHQSTEMKNEVLGLGTNIQFGKVIKDNTVAGIIGGYNYNSGPQYKSNQYNAGVFYRKYKSIAKGLYLFGEGDALYGHSIATQGVLQIDSSGTKSISNGGSLTFNPGISYSICKRMQVELVMQNLFSLSYGVAKYEATSILTSTFSSVKRDNFNASINLNSALLSNFGIGFKFLLGK